MTASMPPSAADWVYDVVITRRYKESAGAIMWTGKGDDRRDEGYGAVMLRTCPCQYGPCGHCGLGRHHRCTHRRFAPTVSPATYVQNPRGYALTPVWTAGKPCAWRCPCVCPAPVTPPLEQLSLFGEIGRQPKRHGQPDRNRPLHPLPPDLFDLFETTVEHQGKAADQ